MRSAALLAVLVFGCAAQKPGVRALEAPPDVPVVVPGLADCAASARGSRDSAAVGAGLGAAAGTGGVAAITEGQQLPPLGQMVVRGLVVGAAIGSVVALVFHNYYEADVRQCAVDAATAKAEAKVTAALQGAGK